MSASATRLLNAHIYNRWTHFYAATIIFSEYQTAHCPIEWPHEAGFQESNYNFSFKVKVADTRKLIGNPNTVLGSINTFVKFSLRIWNVKFMVTENFWGCLFNDEWQRCSYYFDLLRSDCLGLHPWEKFPSGYRGSIYDVYIHTITIMLLDSSYASMAKSLLPQTQTFTSRWAISLECRYSIALQISYTVLAASAITNITFLSIFETNLPKRKKQT